MRKLYSAYSHCKAGCKYCFAKWQGAYHEQPRFGVEHICENEVIVYPCCDGEFFDQSCYVEIAHSLAEHVENIYFSISTKSAVDAQRLTALSNLNQALSSQNKGFVKLSVSLSCKSQISEIEPDTLPYQDRLDLLKQLADAEIPNSITLKPILPFIPDEEYFDILKECRPMTDRVLIGGLYVCPETPFYREYIQNKFPCEKRMVNWLPSKPIWDYVEISEKTENIIQFAESLGYTVFSSDTDLVKSYIQK